MTRAAEAVYLTQSALTQAIARLEGELECRMFDRLPGGMRPTAPAELLAPRVHNALLFSRSIWAGITNTHWVMITSD